MPRLRSETRIAFLHIGAREHYAVPRMVIGAGASVLVLTDFYAGILERTLARLIPPLGRRCHSALFGVEIIDNRLMGLQYFVSRVKYGDSADLHVKFGSRFSEWASSRIPRGVDGIVAFSGSALECFEEHKGRSLLVLDQIDGGISADEFLRREQMQFPDWEAAGDPSSPALDARRKREWTLADLIVCNSSFSKNCLVDQGVNPGKILVIPVAYESLRVPPLRRFPEQRPLRLLFLGRVSIYKGIHHLLSAMDVLSEMWPVTLTVAGSNRLEPSKLSILQRKHRYIGEVSRKRVSELLDEHDLLVFPTIADGFGLVQLEAVAAGMPVVASSACGDVVITGRNGVRMTAVNSAEILRGVLEAREMLVSGQLSSDGVAATASDFSLEKVQHLWATALQERL